MTVELRDYYEGDVYKAEIGDDVSFPAYIIRDDKLYRFHTLITDVSAEYRQIFAMAVK